MKKKLVILLCIVLFCVCACMLMFELQNKSTKIEEESKIAIPKVYLEGNISNMLNKKDIRKVLLKYESTSLNFEKYATIKIQGSSSTKYEKKNYSIELFENDEYLVKSEIEMKENWGKHSNYCLKANWIDKTHARNIVSAKIAGQIQKKYGLFNGTPNNGLIEGFPVEIYINNEFLGLYTWNIPKDIWMWNMDEENENNMIIQGQLYLDQTRFLEVITDFDTSGWKIEIGDTSEKGKTLITEKLNRLIDFVLNSSDEEFIENFENYFNKDAAINYLIGLYLFNASDNYCKNLILATLDGELWYLNLYDLDTTFGTNPEGTDKNDYEWLPEKRNNRLLNRIIECMPEEIANRWFELRKDIITKENILNEFTAFLNSIPEETFQKERERWENIPGYGIDQIEEFLDFRLPYIDNLMKERLEKEK